MDNLVSQAKQKNNPNNKKRKITVIISCVLSILILIFLYAYLFFDYYIPYDKMDGGIDVVERSGHFEFDLHTTDAQNQFEISGGTKSFIYDYDNGVAYDYLCFFVKSQRWNLWFNKGIHTFGLKIDKEGHNIERPKSEFDPNINYREESNKMDRRSIRVYYLNPDGSCVLLWEHPEAEEITARLGVTLPDPNKNEIDWNRSLDKYR